MANRRKEKRKSRMPLGRRLGLAAFLLALGALAALGLTMWMQAHIAHLCHAELYLPDLPQAFDGVRAIYLSDLNLSGASDARSCARLLDKLGALDADMLLLGGDYFAGDADAAALEPFTRALSAFEAPLGKFAVAGEQDTNTAALEALFADTGVQLLSDACAAVTRDGAQLVIAGLSDVDLRRTPYAEMGGYFDGDECVLVLAHNPSAYVGVRVAEARGGGSWADAVFSGHTLGGQIRLFGRNLRTMPEAEARCLGGWYYADDLPMLVSEGLGCRDVDLRLGSRSEVWCVTLRRPQRVEVSLP